MEINFAKILKKNRENLNMTQEELAKKIDVDRTYMSKLEKNDSNPSFSTIKKICQGLGIGIFEFFGGIEKDPAVVFVDIKDREAKENEHRVKGEMLPIKVFKNISVFSLDNDIRRETARKYTYIEKEIILPEDLKGSKRTIDNLVGLQLNKRLDLADFKAKKDSILIISLEGIPMYPELVIYDDSDGKGPSLRRHLFIGTYHIFFNPFKDPLEHEATKIYEKSEFNRNTVRGTVVGIISKY
ncbi:MAG: helix-turn-helix domain-containing protein [Candidatus Aenigmarchaeota archaeon]|nr:helix-turn-helix domain-containing protein [Candidatus Aenigmarchaeota archaeon]